MKINRVLLLLLALPATWLTAATSPLPPRPSIIFIQCHGLAQGDLSCYGQTNFQTPNLDRLAANGIRCTHYTGETDSAATTAQLLGGKISGASAGEANLAQRLQQNGYRTGLIGEWSLAGLPWAQGFDEFAGFMDDAEGKNYYSDFVWRYAPKSIFNETNKTFDAFAGKEALYPNLGGKKGQYLPDLFVSAANNFVRINAPDPANRFRPFFLLVNLPAPRTATTGADDFPVPSDAPFSDEPWPQAAKNRAALITRIDGGIGRLFEQLNKSGLTNNVAVFFSASSAPEKFANTNLNFLLPAGNFSVGKKPALLPMIVNWPETIPAGQVSQQPWTAKDFAPTALELTSVKLATNFTGESVLPMLVGQKSK
ncbi:MAG: sulfatase-like hydrolase/transferase [Verrucomicrobiae bacterium]